MNTGLKKRVLIVEDEPSVRDILIRLLTLEGYLPIAAQDGLEGVELALRSPPDLIMCDVNMPGLDGFGVLTRLRAEPTTADVPFIFLTACAQEEDAAAGYRLGASEYVTKPFSIPALVALLRRKLGGQGEAS